MANDTQRRTEIAVVGSGPSGMIAAILLARKGFEVVLLGPKAKADRRTTALLDASVKILEEIGVWQALLPEATPMRQMRLVDDTRRLIRAPETLFDCTEIGLEAFGYNVLNDALNAVLEKTVAEMEISRVEAFATDACVLEDGVEITVEGGERITARLVAASDGRNSRMRDAAGIEVRRWTYPQSALVANLSHDLPHHEISTEFHTPYGPFTLVPLPGTMSSLVWVGRPEDVGPMAALDPDAFADVVERQAKSFLGRMRLEGDKQIFPLSGLKAKSVAERRIALIGETAHVFPPIGAQGLNLSLRDIAALGDAAARSRDAGQDIGGEATLKRYRAARRNDIDTRILGVDTLNRTLLADFLPAQVARSVGLYLAGRVGPLRRLLMREGVAPKLTRMIPVP